MPLEKLERVTKLSPLVLRVLGHNPGSFQLQGTNMYLVGAGASRILIDAGEGKKEDLPTLLRALADDGGERISDVLITHFHHDHTEGIKDLRAHYGESLRVWKMPWAPGVLVPWTRLEHGPSFDMVKLGVRMLEDAQTLRTEAGDASVRVLATPGHTVDHACFVLEEEGALFSGDHVLGGSSGVFDELHDYMLSLDRALQELPKGRGGRIYPGPGVVLPDGHQAVCDYIANRKNREKQVVDALTAQPNGATPYALVKAIYPQLSFALTLAAASNVEKTLRKLQKDGRASALALSPVSIKLFGIGFDWVFCKLWRLRTDGEPDPRPVAVWAANGTVRTIGAGAVAAALGIAFACARRLTQ